MNTIFGILGFIVGLILFVIALDKFQMIFIGFKSIIGMLFLCWVIGIILVWIAWKVAVFIGIGGLIYYVLSKITGKPSEKTTDNAEPEKKKQED